MKKVARWAMKWELRRIADIRNQRSDIRRQGGGEGERGRRGRAIEEGFIAQRPCDGKEYLAMKGSLGMTCLHFGAQRSETLGLRSLDYPCRTASR